MNVYLPGVRLGIGDVLCRNFHNRPSARHLATMVNGYRSGKFDRIAVVGPESGDEGFSGWNQACFEIFAALGIQSRDRNGVVGWSDVRELNGDEPEHPLRVPTVRPSGAIPRKFILFSQHAGRADRCLDDPELYHAIKAATNLPIVKVGKQMPAREGTDVPPIPCDLDLSGKTTIPQTCWLAQRAVCIVAPCSWLRCMTWAFGTPVVECIQGMRATSETMQRTNIEYADGRQYGMNELNFWLTLPEHWNELGRALKLCLGPERPATLWPR